MNTREHTRLSAVTDTIVIDDLAGVALLSDDTVDAEVRWANGAFAALLGRPGADLAGTRLADVVADDELVSALRGDGRERTARLASGAAGRVLQVSPTTRSDGAAVAVVTPTHATPRAAMYDAVTGLASLPLLREHLQLGLHRRARDGDDVAVLLVGVPDFAAAWQSEVGPASLLQTRVAERIEQVVRDADVLAARRPGSFALLVGDPADAVAAGALVADRMLAAFATPFAMTDRLQRLPLAIGIAGATAGDEPDDVLGRAEEALAQARADGADVYRVRLGDR